MCSICINELLLFMCRLSSGSERADRDIVQFVPYRNFSHVNKV